MAMLTTLLSRSGNWSLSLRLLLLSLIVTAVIQVLKMCIPYLNGWIAVALNAFVSTLAVVFVIGYNGPGELAQTILLVALASAGIHGTATKLSDFPNPRENPTPSGTPAQNYDKIDAGP